MKTVRWPANIPVVPASGGFVTASGEARALGASTPHEVWVGIVDDDAALRTALARALRGNGICVETFASAEEFLHRPGGQPDCIVLDIHLGGLSGFELQDLLTSRGDSPPIVFMTAHDDIPCERLRSRTACGYLRKPFETRALLALLRPHLRCSSTE